MLKISLRIAGHTVLIFRRIALVLMLLLALSAAALILILRYSILPDIEHYRPDIKAAVTKALGVPVEIEKIEADWHGLGPHLRLSDIRILDHQNRTTLALQKVDVVVSWMSLLAGELRLSSLEIDKPDLMLKRNTKGEITISGVQLGGKSADNNFADLLLNQARIVVRGARIAWLDEKAAKPLLVFDDVNLMIESGWNYHQFAMRATPPSELATQLDVRGNLHGKSFDNLQGWSGEIFTQLEYADLAAWKTWLPIPVSLKQGRGALRGWMELEDGEVSDLTADLALVNVQTRLANDLPPLDIRVLSGRVDWRDRAQSAEISLKHFSLKLFDDFVLKPTDIFIKLSKEKAGENSSGEVLANYVDLNGLGKLMEYLPVERELKKQFADYSPQGRVENVHALWQADTKNKLHYKVRGRFDNLSLQRVGQLPGFSGLTGEVDGSDQNGTLTINSRDLKVDAPLFMPEPLAFDTLSAQFGWKMNSQGVEVKLRNVAVTNDDVAGTAYGSFQTLRDSPGKIDLNVHLSRASVRHAGKYIPLIALGKESKDWVNKALLDGQSNDFNLRIKGNLNDFPFVHNNKGIFKIQARAKDVALEYDPEWPLIQHGNAELLIQGNELEVTASSADTSGVNLKNVKVTIPDVSANDLRLLIRGEAEADNALALEYVNASPVRGYLDGYTDSISAKGKGKLLLNLDIPLQGEQSAKVEGNYRFINSEIDYAKNLPALRKVNGNLTFTESSVSTSNITADILGGPATLVINSGEGGKLDIKLGGRANLAALREQWPSHLLNKLSGNPAWNIDVSVQNKLRKVQFSSTLLGLQSDLPAPLSKNAEQSIPVSFELKDVTSNRQMVTLKYGTLLNGQLLRKKNTKDVWQLTRGIINFGNVVQKADRDGLWMIGTVPEISLKGWDVLAEMIATDKGDSAINLDGVDVSVQKLTGYGNLINDLHIRANNRDAVLTAQLASKELNGQVIWQGSSGQDGDYGRIVARFKNLDLGLGESEVDKKSETEIILPEKNSDTTNLPSVDLSIERLSYKGRQLGKLEMLAYQDGREYQLERMQLSNPDGVLSGDGSWDMQGEDAETQLNLMLDTSNAGNMLARTGFPNAIKNGSGKLQASLAWPGTPGMYSDANLNGTLSLDTGKGQFLQVEPGIGKLLSILSLQALPKRIALDFEDVFSKGFEFDNIKGTAAIKQGVMSTEDFKIDGSAAKVSMVGQVDLHKETQNLRVRVVPAVGNSAALLSWFLATPVIGASVFLANKILNDPLGQLVSFEYNISGNWADPKVEKIAKKKNNEPAE